MENLEHEDLLIKLRAKLNEEKIKLWEPPYLQSDVDINQSIMDLAKRYATELNIAEDVVLQALQELQTHSVDRCKDNSQFNETGLATIRVKATVPGQKPNVIKVQKGLDAMAAELITDISKEVGVAESRIKLIFNGKVITASENLERQGIKNGSLLMALIMIDNPEEAKKEDSMYRQMVSIRADAQLLSEATDDAAEDYDFQFTLEDQAGKAVSLPLAERRALMVALALHERARTASKQRDHALALVLLLEADRLFSECSSSLLQSVDNWAALQLDVAWCYLCLRSLPAAGDAAARLERAERAFRASYGERQQRVLALKGTAGNERVLLMRLHLLQGIVAYHQNRREEARRLLQRAEAELAALRVDPTSMKTLMLLGWTEGQARRGLRASGGDLDQAHHYLAERRRESEAARERREAERSARALGVCADGAAVRAELVGALQGMGYPRRLALAALRLGNNCVAEAVRLIQEEPDTLGEQSSSEGTDTTSSDDSSVEPDARLVAELEAMGYAREAAREALRRARNHISGAVDRLVAAGGQLAAPGPASASAAAAAAAACPDPANPSTSVEAGNPKKKPKLSKAEKRRKERKSAWKRLSPGIKADEEDHLDSSLKEEEQFLAQYMSLL